MVVRVRSSVWEPSRRPLYLIIRALLPLSRPKSNASGHAVTFERVADSHNRGSAWYDVGLGASEQQMISIRGNGVRLCDGLTRRDVLRVGGLGIAGLSLPQLLQSEALAARREGGPKRERSIILFFLQGGQSQL